MLLKIKQVFDAKEEKYIDKNAFDTKKKTIKESISGFCKGVLSRKA